MIPGQGCPTGAALWHGRLDTPRPMPSPAVTVWGANGWGISGEHSNTVKFTRISMWSSSWSAFPETRGTRVLTADDGVQKPVSGARVQAPHDRILTRRAPAARLTRGTPKTSQSVTRAGGPAGRGAAAAARLHQVPARLRTEATPPYWAP